METMEVAEGHRLRRGRRTPPDDDGYDCQRGTSARGGIVSLVHTPNDPALARVSAATLRVGNASGFLVRKGNARVVVTASHVVGNDAQVTLRWPGGQGRTTVLQKHPKADVAVLADLPGIPGAGLELAPAGKAVGVGERVWIAGFPSGWQEIHPVLSTGIVSGVGNESWISGASTWGNSGGPVAAVEGDDVHVIALVTGLGSKAHADLEAAVQALRQTEQAVKSATDGTVIRMGGLSIGDYAAYTARALASVCNFIEAHFRSGFVRIEPYDKILESLG